MENSAVEGPSPILHRIVSGRQRLEQSELKPISNVSTISLGELFEHDA